jgi:hypothetical protein
VSGVHVNHVYCSFHSLTPAKLGAKLLYSIVDHGTIVSMSCFDMHIPHTFLFISIHSTDSDREEEIQDRASSDSDSEQSRETFVEAVHQKSKHKARKLKEVTIKKKKRRSSSVPEDEDRAPKRRPLSENFHTNREQQRLTNHPNMSKGGTGSRKPQRKDNDSDNESVVNQEDQIQELKLQCLRLKKRAKYAAIGSKTGVKKASKTLTAMQQMVRKRTKTELWPVAKFFNSDKKLHLGTVFIMKHINPLEISELTGAEQVDRQEEWCANYKEDVRISMNVVRNYCQQELREFMFKIFANNDEDQYPNEVQIRDLMERKGLQKGANKKQTEGFFDKYWDELIPKVAGSSNWPPTKRHYFLLSTAETDPKIEVDPKKDNAKVVFLCVDHSSEAFLVAIWENCYPRWRYQALQKRKGEEVVETHDEMKGKDYTTSKTGRNKFGGWTKKGRDRVKELAKMSKTARELPHVEVVETAALQRIRYVFGFNLYPNVVFLHPH